MSIVSRPSTQCEPPQERPFRSFLSRSSLHIGRILVSSLACLGCKVYEPAPAVSGGTESTLGPLNPSTATQAAQEQSPDPAPESNLPCTPGDAVDCSESAQGQTILFPGGTPVGNCCFGRKVCDSNGQWGPCLGAIAPQARDRCHNAWDDSNCNGASGEGCECVVGSRPRPCGSSEGVCQEGVQFCRAGKWTECQGAIAPSAEICDGKGLDEDCDGLVDLLDEDNCSCLVGEAEHCELKGQRGDCAFGIRHCAMGRWGRCEQRFSKTLEHCGQPRKDQMGQAPGDEDCDGEVDEFEPRSIQSTCKIFMVDLDGDGYGAVGPSFEDDPESATWGCFCPSRVLLPKAVPAGPNRHNKDCGDCPGESGKLVYPGNQKFYEKRSVCLAETGWPGGSYDYNCDNKEELRFLGVHGCEYNAKAECEHVGPGYWAKSGDEKDPACGTYGWRKSCKEYDPVDAEPFCVLRSGMMWREKQQCR